MINRVYSIYSNSSWFNPIFQKFCAIIVSKTLGVIFLIFCRSRYINNFIVKSNFSEPKIISSQNHISRSIHFKKISTRGFEFLICTNKLEGFSKKCFFQGLGTLFMNTKFLIWAFFLP